MNKKVILFFVLSSFYFIMGIVSGLMIPDRIMLKILTAGAAILLYIWLSLDCLQFNIDNSDLTKALTLMTLLPLFWHIFETRKFKGGMILILKCIGLIILSNLLFFFSSIVAEILFN